MRSILLTLVLVTACQASKRTRYAIGAAVAATGTVVLAAARSKDCDANIDCEVNRFAVQGIGLLTLAVGITSLILVTGEEDAPRP